MSVFNECSAIRSCIFSTPRVGKTLLANTNKSPLKHFLLNIKGIGGGGEKVLVSVVAFVQMFGSILILTGF